jgi:hypothetical protein
VSGKWRKLHNEELHDLYSSPSIIRIMKARRMRWAGHVALMGEKRIAYRLLVGKPMTRFYFFLSVTGKLHRSWSWGALSDERTGL